MNEFITHTRYECCYCGKELKDLPIMEKHLDEFCFMSNKNINGTYYRPIFLQDFINEINEFFNFNFDVTEEEKGKPKIQVEFPFNIDIIENDYNSVYWFVLDFTKGEPIYKQLKDYLLWLIWSVEYAEDHGRPYTGKGDYYYSKKAKESKLYKRLMEVSI